MGDRGVEATNTDTSRAKHVTHVGCEMIWEWLVPERTGEHPPCQSTSLLTRFPQMGLAGLTRPQLKLAAGGSAGSPVCWGGASAGFK